MSIASSNRFRRFIERVRHRIADCRPTTSLYSGKSVKMTTEGSCLICNDGYKAEGTALVKPCITCDQYWCRFLFHIYVCFRLTSNQASSASWRSAPWPPNPLEICPQSAAEPLTHVLCSKSCQRRLMRTTNLFLMSLVQRSRSAYIAQIETATLLFHRTK
jgi:hypothetical protein